jgi:hypothetical protein
MHRLQKTIFCCHRNDAKVLGDFSI